VQNKLENPNNNQILWQILEFITIGRNLLEQFNLANRYVQIVFIKKNR
jgi:hypothetical protein